MLVVEVINLGTYIFATFLLFHEYVRKMQEAWYTHKFFVWTNLILGSAHLVFFWWLYSKLLLSMIIIRYAIFFMLLVAQCFT